MISIFWRVVVFRMNLCGENALSHLGKKFSLAVFVSVLIHIIQMQGNGCGFYYNGFHCRMQRKSGQRSGMHQRSLASHQPSAISYQPSGGVETRFIASQLNDLSRLKTVMNYETQLRRNELRLYGGIIGLPPMGEALPISDQGVRGAACGRSTKG